MPIIEFNDKLTRIVRGRTIQLVAQEEGLVKIVIHDYSTMRVYSNPTTCRAWVYNRQG